MVSEDGIFDGPRPQDAFSKGMEYKERLATSYQEVEKTLEKYIDELPKEDKNFLEQKTGLYNGISKIRSKKDSNRNSETMDALTKIEKEKGLLRKLLDN